MNAWSENVGKNCRYTFNKNYKKKKKLWKSRPWVFWSHGRDPKQNRVTAVTPPNPRPWLGHPPTIFFLFFFVCLVLYGQIVHDSFIFIMLNCPFWLYQLIFVNNWERKDKYKSELCRTIAKLSKAAVELMCLALSHFNTCDKWRSNKLCAAFDHWNLKKKGNMYLVVDYISYAMIH